MKVQAHWNGVWSLLAYKVIFIRTKASQPGQRSSINVTGVVAYASEDSKKDKPKAGHIRVNGERYSSLVETLSQAENLRPPF